MTQEKPDRDAVARGDGNDIPDHAVERPRRPSFFSKGSAMGRVRVGLSTTFEWVNVLGVSMIFLMMILITLDVSLRFLFRAPIMGSVEIVQFMLVIAVFFGLAHTQRAGENIRMTLLVDSLPVRLQAAIDAVTGLVTTGLCVAIAYAFYYHISGRYGRVLTTDLLEVPLWPFKALAMAGVVLLVVQLVFELIENLAIAATGRSAEQ